MVNCPICDSTKTKRYYSNQALSLFRCKTCGVKFQHPMPAPEVLGKIYSSEYYDSFYPEKNLGEQRLLFQERLEMLENLREDKKGKVLDVGCGRGVFLEVAKERGWDCIGQEFSRDAAMTLETRLGVEIFVCNNLSEAKFQPESFDLVNMNHVLEHIYEPVKTIREIYRILKPGGIFYCEVPRQSNFLNLLSNIFGKRDFGFSYLPEYLFLLDVRSMSLLLEDSGFELLAIKIEGSGDPHRYVRGIHYNSFWTHIIVKVLLGTLRLQIPLGGGNLVVISRKIFRK